MRGNLTLSAVIPFYNAHQFIDETLYSVKYQKRAFDEIIIVNDGSSSQDSLDKLGELERRSDVRVIHQENQGVAAALTRGAQEASSEIIFEIDADDILLEDYTQEYMSIFEDDASVGLVTSGYHMFLNGDDYSDPRSFYKSYMPLGFREPDMFFYNCICGQNTAFRKISLEKTEYWQRERFDGPQDWGIGLEFHERSIKMRVIDEYLYLYRVHASGFSQRIEKDHNFDEALRKKMGLIQHGDEGHYTLKEYTQQKDIYKKSRGSIPHGNHYKKFTMKMIGSNTKRIILNIKKEGYIKTCRRVLSHIGGNRGEL